MPTPSAGKKNSLFSMLKRAFTLVLATGILLSSLFLYKSTAYAATESWVNSVRTSILALGSARTTALKELESLSLSTQETADYRDFVVYLNTRIISYCRELAQQASSSALTDLPCPKVAGLAVEQEKADQDTEIKKTMPLPPAGMGTSQTQAEKTGALDDQFLDALGDFDEMLLKEDKKVASRVPRQRETGDTGMAGAQTGSGAAGSAGTAGSGEFDADGQQGMETGEGPAAEGVSGTQTGKTGGNGAPGAGGTGKRTEQTRVGVRGGQLPPPEDDDIVARQLREAAEKETDPELKKKLWEEYYKYKGITPKGG